MSETLEDKFFHYCNNNENSCENCQYRDSGDLVNCALNYGYQQGKTDALADEDKEILDLFHGTSKTMQKSVIEILKVTQGRKEMDNGHS